ncbi:hypothetical protein [Cellulosimicrobium sp. TH-20]|uniref:hypothetical protein n=1 Tax=Cellulosimicrobium sp. TH-20 TaxID=1980001 RepID=UPI0011A3F25A|nr:hypothetical protein [Cellulosimicrobium sp. TH-20]
MTASTLPGIPARPTLAETLETIGVRKVYVTASIAFEAYVLADHDERPEDIVHRIAIELGDAIEYRAPNLTDTEPGDALVTLVASPRVEVDGAERLAGGSILHAIERAEGYAGEL